MSVGPRKVGGSLREEQAASWLCRDVKMITKTILNDTSFLKEHIMAKLYGFNRSYHLKEKSISDQGHDTRSYHLTINQYRL